MNYIYIWNIYRKERKKKAALTAPDSSVLLDPWSGFHRLVIYHIWYQLIGKKGHDTVRFFKMGNVKISVVDWAKFCFSSKHFFYFLENSGRLIARFLTSAPRWLRWRHARNLLSLFFPMLLFVSLANRRSSSSGDDDILAPKALMDLFAWCNSFVSFAPRRAYWY